MLIASGSLGPLPFGYLLYQTGLWALWFLLASLAITPARAIFGWGRAILVRRMLGLAGLGYTIAHAVLYFGDRQPPIRFWNELMRRPTISVAIAATIGLVLLGVTSFDGAIRAMGSRAWNQLHDLAYPAIGLATLHFAMSPFSVGGPPFVVAGVFFWLMAWRVLARFRDGSVPSALAALAFASAAFTLVFTVAWLALYQHRPALPQLRLAFDLGGGLSPTGQVLLTGLSVALLAAVFGSAQRQERPRFPRPFKVSG